MAILPWRFQSDIPIDSETGALKTADPDVTVFVGSTYTNDVTGETVFHQDTSNPQVMKLSELTPFLTTAMNGLSRDSLKKIQPFPEMPKPTPPVAVTPEVKGAKK